MGSGVVENQSASGGSLGGQPGALCLQFFVYGTLMGGGSRSMDRMGLQLIEEEARVPGLLYAVGSSFPALLPGREEGPWHERPQQVVGELWRAFDEDHALAVLEVTDAIEGYRPNDRGSSMYLREHVRLAHPDGEVAWTYYWNNSRTYLQRIWTGSWRKWLLEPNENRPRR